MSLLRLRWAVLLTTAVLGITAQGAAASANLTLVPSPIHCQLDAPTCGLTLPPDADPHPSTGGGRGPGGGRDDGGITGGMNDSYCAAQRAALGSEANTAFGMQLLQSIGCP